MGMVVRRYIDFLILLSVLFCSSIPIFSFKKMFFIIYMHIYIYTDSEIIVLTRWG